VSADPVLIERALASGGVERTPVPPESSYFGELLGAAAEFFVRALMAGAKRLHVPPGVLWWIAAGLAALLVLAIARLAFSRLRRRKVVREGAEAVTAALPPAAPRDAAAWRAELERRLAEGRIPEALEALWWWLARSLAGGEAEPDWTSRDLMARSRREDLRELVRRLDAFTYGPRPPGIEDLRGLLGRLEEALA
jgi:hypothetical protein